MMINNIINFCIIVICTVINLGVSFMNIYHEYKIVYLYAAKIGGCRQVNPVIESSGPIISNIFDVLIH